ncbi:MAG: penicillin-binding transpeptidase domain-containing protein [Bacteroidales bacterium]|nr:penicillin-binding transpeptidase domain-containing protein [Clostridium sp.]MCM1204921.1 penicillin-binding transpeptidase domain-containing protein [Bacteroidales bacterium]
MIKELLHAMKEYIIEYISHRLFILSVVIFVLFAMLIGRLFRLQIVEGETHLDNFTYKSKKTLTDEAARGNIYDCNGKLLAYNQLAYSVTFENSNKLTEVASDNHVSENELKNVIVDKTIRILERNGDSISVDFPIVYRDGLLRYNTISDAERLRFIAEVYGESSADDLTEEQQHYTAQQVFDYLAGEKRFNISADYSTREALKIMSVRYALWLNRFQQYISVTIAMDISDRSVAELNENSSELLGIDVIVDSMRVYNDSKYFAHIIGYIGAISTDEMKTHNENLSEKNQYSSNDMIGKTGLEQKYERTLRGTNGIEEIYVDNLGKIIERNKQEDSVAGEDIYLTIDSDLQKYCYDTLEKEIASVLLAHITDEVVDEEKNPEKSIPIADVYYALFDNNALDITHLAAEDAGAYETTVNNTLNSTREYVLSRIQRILLTENTAMNNLDNENTAYMEYIYSCLASNNIYDTKKIESTDETYKEYVAGNISLGTFLQYAINQGAIDISPFELSSDYYDSQEVYTALVDYVTDILSKDTEFDKLIMKYMIKSGNVNGVQIIHILFEQGVLDREEDKDYTDFMSGKLSDYRFIRRKISNLDITPAQLALDPCEGSVVVADVNTGEILAMVSYPSYDNNLLTNSVDSEYYTKLLMDKTKPLYNRATQQRTAPGSIYKMLTTIAAVEENAIDLDTMIEDEGSFVKEDPPPKCWIYPGNHGTIGIEEALEVSCNYFFYEVGYRLGGGENHFSDADGLSKLSKYAALFGLDTNSGIELDEISPKVSDESIVRSAIGQGTNSYTPTQLSRYVTTLATSGTCYDLSIIKEIKNLEGKTTYKNPHNVHDTVDIHSSLWNTVHNGMRRVLENHTPEEMLINQIDVKVAGKTGTAEENLARPAHALFVSYAPFNRPEISVTTVIPYGYSSGNAEELAGFIYAYYFDPEKLENASITGNVNMID